MISACFVDVCDIVWVIAGEAGFLLWRYSDENDQEETRVWLILS